MTRAWFRRRLDEDPRRWVLLLAALAGLSGFALNWAERPDHHEAGPATAVWLVFAAIAPAAGVLGMLVHGRLLWWTGKLLGGRARPAEIHAAFAWSELPFVAGAAPLVLALPLRVVAAQADPAPAALRRAADAFGAASGALVGLALLAAVSGGLLYVRFLGEAQGFRPGRALLNHLLAGLALMVLVAAGVAVGAWALSGSSLPVRVLAGMAVTGALALALDAVARRSRPRGAPA